MKIGVFGGSGYLGSSSIGYLSEWHEIINLQRNEDIPPGLHVILDCSFPSRFRRKAVKRNYRMLLEKRIITASNLDTRYIYIGSFSSSKNSKSKYGIYKYELEELIQLNGGVILRIALVVDEVKPGGRYSELIQIISRMPFVVLPHEDLFRLQVSSLEEYKESLRWCIENIVTSFQRGELLAPHSETSLKQLVMDIDIMHHKSHIEISRRSSRLVEWVVTYLPLGKFDSLKSIVGDKNAN